MRYQDGGTLACIRVATTYTVLHHRNLVRSASRRQAVRDKNHAFQPLALRGARDGVDGVKDLVLHTAVQRRGLPLGDESREMETGTHAGRSQAHQTATGRPLAAPRA